MYRLIIIILLLVLNINCTGDKEPIIKLGKIFDKTKIEVSDETDIFDKNDNFAYILSRKEPFITEIITRRFYQGKEYIDMILKESVDIKINPGTKKIGESIPVENLVQKYGSGEFLILFTTNNYVIAKKSFIIKGNVIKNIKVPEEQAGRQEIMPNRTEENMPRPNTYGTEKTVPNIKSNPVESEKYVPNPEQRRDDVPIKRREKINPLSPSEMMNDNK